MSSRNKTSSLLFLLTVAVLLVLCTSCLHSFTEAKPRKSAVLSSCQSTLRSCLARATASRDSLQRARCSSTDFTTCQKSRLVRSAKKRASRELLSDDNFEQSTVVKYCMAQCSDAACYEKCSRSFRSVSEEEFLSEDKYRKRTVPIYCAMQCSDAACLDRCSLAFTKF